MTDAPSIPEVTQAAQTPLVELLRAIPVGYRAEWTDPDGVQATHYAPIGRYCHEAADRLSRTPHPVAAEGLIERMARFIECIADADREGWNDATIDEARRITIDHRDNLTARPPVAVPGEVGLREALEKAAGWFEEYATEHYRKALTAPDGREQHGREVKGKLNRDRADELRTALKDHPTDGGRDG